MFVACDAGDVEVQGGSQPPAAGGGAELARDASMSSLDASRPDAAQPNGPQNPLGTGVADAGMRDAGPADSGTKNPPPEPPAPPKVEVTFSPPGQGFTDKLMLSLSGGPSDAQVHYTLDGSLPSATSPQATGPIPIVQTTLVRAIAVRNGVATPVVNQSYFQLDTDVQSFDSNLPIVIVHMLGGAAPNPSSREYQSSMFGLFDGGTARAKLLGPATHTSRLGVKIRGRSTRNQPKPSYTLELRGTADEDAPASLLGMPKDGDWVLYAPYDMDKSMLHNVFAYDLSRQINRYAPRTQFCEVFFVAGNGKVTQASYAGVYVLTERLTRSKDRVAIEKLEPGDAVDPIVSGGYIVKVDEPDEPAESFKAAGGLTFIYDDPDVDEITPEQKDYIEDYLDACWRAVTAANGVDAATGKRYDELIDVPSFIDHHILTLLMKNPDGFVLSSYFYKDRNGKLFAGPLWDFDLAMGANDPWGQRSVNPQYWGPGTMSELFKRSFWGPLFTHAEFAATYWARWDELLSTTFTSAKFHATVDALESKVTEAELRNRARWPAGAPRNNSYPDEVDALEAWLDARLTWINANKGSVPQ